MNLNIKLDYKSILSKLLAKFSIVLWVFLGLVIFAEALVIQDSVAKILQANNLSQFSGAQLTRVNFTLYEQLEKRLTENSAFLPDEPSTEDPFGLALDVE